MGVFHIQGTQILLSTVIQKKEGHIILTTGFYTEKRKKDNIYCYWNSWCDSLKSHMVAEQLWHLVLTHSTGGIKAEMVSGEELGILVMLAIS